MIQEDKQDLANRRQHAARDIIQRSYLCWCSENEFESYLFLLCESIRAGYWLLHQHQPPAKAPNRLLSFGQVQGSVRSKPVKLYDPLQSEGDAYGHPVLGYFSSQRPFPYSSPSARSVKSGAQPALPGQGKSCHSDTILLKPLRPDLTVAKDPALNRGRYWPYTDSS